MLVVGGLLALAFQWRTMGRTFASIFTSFGGKRNAPKGPLDHIEIPMTWFVFGFLVTGILAALLLTWIFSIHWWMGAVAVVLTFFLAAVAARAGAEIGMNPIGALGKVTQLTYGVLAPGNIAANLMTAGVTAGAACSCSDTVGNLKVGHMVGANPRKQFIAQLFGVLAGALLAVPAYFILVPDANDLGGDKFPAPSALVWMGVAKVLSKGLSTLPPSAVMAVVVAFVVGVIIVVVDRVFPKAKPYTPSPAALGIAMTIPASTSFAMFLGALIAWILEKKARQVERHVHDPHRLRLHRRREHHGGDHRGADGDRPVVVIARQTINSLSTCGRPLEVTRRRKLLKSTPFAQNLKARQGGTF